MTSSDSPEQGMESHDTVERWRTMQRVLDDALDRPPSERLAYVAAACGTDAALYDGVTRLLTGCERAALATGLLASPAIEFAAPLLAGAFEHDSAAEAKRRAALGDALGAALSERYAVERELGYGGMATVFLTRDLRHGRSVAVKVMDRNVAHAGAERFLDEISIAARLTHPHVLSIHDSGEAAGMLYYVMPYVDGETLRAWLTREGALSLTDAVRLLRELADALAYAHGHGVVHRDLKPENILLSGGHAVVADFGIAKALAVATEDDDSFASGNRSVGLVLGTPAYMAPEQAVGDASADHRSDLYALGVIAYEILAGAHPFAGRTARALVVANLTENPAPLATVRRDVPPALASLVMRLLAKDPAARPSSADEVLHALDAVAPTLAGSTARSVAHRGRSVFLAAIALVMLIVGVRWYVVGHSAPASVLRPSVAVLPFQNTSGDSTDEHFSDGLTDELIGALGKVGGLRVAGRTSTFALKKSRLGVRAVAETLGVATVLEGSVRRAGGHLRVGAQLVSGADGAVLWSDSYDRELADVFVVQEEIARAIVAALQVRLGAAGAPRVRRATRDSLAYDLYLQGRYAFWTHPSRGAGLAIGYFERAVARDPSYAAAYAGLSDAYTRLALFGAAPPRETFAKAWVAAQRALALDSSLAEAHVSMGHVRLLTDHAWADADREFKRAIELDPSYTFARAPYAVSLASRGRFAEAIAQLDTVRTIDPLALPMMNLLGRVYVAARRPDDAIAIMSKSLQLDPQADLGWEQLGHAYLQKRMHPEAIAAFRKAAALSGQRDSAELAYAYGVTGQRPEAARVLRRLLDPSRPGPVLSYHIAMAYAGMGEADSAFAWLDRGLAEGASFMSWSKVEPGFASLHGDRRWAPLLRSIGFAP